MKKLGKISVTVFAATILMGGEIQKAPLSEDFVRYQEKMKQGIDMSKTVDGYHLGYIPHPAELITVPASNKNKGTTQFDAVYDLRDHGFVSSVKNQGQCGACWTFASMGAIESNWLKAGDDEYDLSENNLKNGNGFESDHCSGGNEKMSTSYFSRASGPVLEADDPYNINSDEYNSSVPTIKYLGNARFLSNDMDELKSAILGHGALYTNMYWDDTYYNSSNKTYFCSDANAVTNHAVLLVGWDDTKVTAGGTGAWIIKNSWGSGWGEGGFFYISYNDAQVNSSPAYWPGKYGFSSNEKVGHYTDLGYLSGIGFGETYAYGLMRYTPENETAMMVGTWAVSADSYIKVEVYDNFSSGVLSSKLGESEYHYCQNAGYYTVPLIETIDLSSGDDVYIKVNYEMLSNYPVPLETFIDGYADPVIEEGRYWISASGSIWTSMDDYDSDICITVFSTYLNEPITTIDTLFFEGYEYPLEDWTIIDNDNDGSYWERFYEIPAADTFSHSGYGGMGIYYNAEGNDDWLISPQITLSQAEQIHLSFWAHSHTSQYLEDFNVRISTTGKNIEDFIYTLAEERQVPDAWTKYQYSLQELIDSSFYIAIQGVSVDKWYLWVDDFMISSKNYITKTDPMEGPSHFVLHQNYPNPFNPSTKISYDIPTVSDVQLSVYDLSGRVIKSWNMTKQMPGRYELQWRGLNNEGNKVSTGIYFYKLSTGAFTETKKMVFLK
jgi:C1A family cysteine protease